MMRAAPVALFAFLVAACAAPQKWQAPARLDPSDAHLLLESTDPGELENALLVRELPEIPMPKNLRPCCIMGDNARVRLGKLPLPFFRLPNTRGPIDLGEHTYGTGLVRTVRSGRAEPSVDSENNGLVYTCRGGFVDTAHLREWADWTLYFAIAFARNASQGLEIDFPAGGAPIKVTLEPIAPEIASEIGLRRLAVALAQWTTFHLSTWHEIETWYGAHSVPGWSEEASAYSPEDMFSNMLGIRIAGGVINHRGGAESEALYNEAVGNWIQGVLEHLGAVPRPLARQAATAVDGLWWSSKARLPDRDHTLRRNFQFDVQTPWLVPASRLADPAFAELRAACGDNPTPVTVVAPQSIEGHKFEKWVTIEFQLEKKLAGSEPFPSYGSSVTQKDLPDIIAVNRKQNEEEFGKGSDQPD